MPWCLHGMPIEALLIPAFVFFSAYIHDISRYMILGNERILKILAWHGTQPQAVRNLSCEGPRVNLNGHCYSFIMSDSFISADFLPHYIKVCFSLHSIPSSSEHHLQPQFSSTCKRSITHKLSYKQTTLFTQWLIRHPSLTPSRSAAQPSPSQKNLPSPTPAF